MNCHIRSQTVKRIGTTLLTICSCYLFILFYFQNLNVPEYVTELSQSLIEIDLPYQCVQTKQLKGKILAI